MGNHRDAWVFGAVDPNSGPTAMLGDGACFRIFVEERVEAATHDRAGELGR